MVSKVMKTSMIMNVFLAVLKVISGFLLKSNALISDGIHSFSDLLTDVFAIIGNKLSLKPADKEHPYGHGKIEYLTSIVIGLIILWVGFEVIISSLKNPIIIPSIWVLMVSLITITLKLLVSEYIIQKGKQMKNNIVIASGKESRMDVISSIVVLLSVLFMQLSKFHKIFKYSDKVASILVGIFIIYSGFSIIKENISIILGKQEDDEEFLNNLKRIILENPKISHIDSLYLLKFGSTYELCLTISMDGNISLKKAHEMMDILEEKIRKFDKKIEYINIHMEPT